MKAELAALRSSNDSVTSGAQRDEAVRRAVADEVERRERDLAKLTAQLDALVRSSSEVRYLINADWSELAQLSGGGFIPDTSEGNANWLDEYIPQEHRDLVRAEIARAIGEKDTYHIEHKVNRVNGTVGWALSRAVPLFDESGEIMSWMGAASDITDRKSAEEAQRILNEELAHRMKNMLALVQAITTQTLRQASSLEEGRVAISERLGALARAQDILTQANFAETGIRTVVAAALAPHQDVGERIVAEGPSINLASQRALGLSLAIHELATNAVKYGSLSNEEGRVSVRWDVVDGVFSFDWIETGGPVVVDPPRRGFGSRLIEQIVGSYFDGNGRIDFDASGIQFHLTGTASSLELQA
ncbi:HWE histidine kinase domain-containing protein [Aurantimonas sp. VKM B-3413]|uniref:HWE histidine kinase domain-containing protein n=1 Tax=Aurantimonas sp. VKM B-3413 TaxID=2779401 RepID=UPI001E3F12E7|nr:HWE histidine kinase domain-containing protein [Aurantimonas sp. VKM B-3413]MCB8838772.1 PAS domain-containing protein [Aurantimonas sp. VKM B-3413]